MGADEKASPPARQQRCAFKLHEHSVYCNFGLKLLFIDSAVVGVVVFVVFGKKKVKKMA